MSIQTHKKDLCIWEFAEFQFIYLLEKKRNILIRFNNDCKIKFVIFKYFSSAKKMQIFSQYITVIITYDT